MRVFLCADTGVKNLNENMWDIIIGPLNIHYSIDLFHRDDDDIIYIFLDKPWDKLEGKEYAEHFTNQYVMQLHPSSKGYATIFLGIKYNHTPVIRLLLYITIFASNALLYCCMKYSVVGGK
jgi:hypothetical protein